MAYNKIGSWKLAFYHVCLDPTEEKKHNKLWAIVVIRKNSCQSVEHTHTNTNKMKWDEKQNKKLFMFMFKLNLFK